MDDIYSEITRENMDAVHERERETDDENYVEDEEVENSSELES